MFLQFVRLNNYQYDITQKTYYDMNQPDVLDSLKKMEAISDPFFRSVMVSLPVAASLKPYYDKSQVFSRERNEKMAKNIMEYIETYPGKRIVVLTGLLHKPYLIDLLNTSPQKNLFTIAEFYNPAL